MKTLLRTISFNLSYFWKNLVLTLRLLARGEWGRVYKALHARVFVRLHGYLFDFLWVNLVLMLKLLARGEWGRVYNTLHAPMYVRLHGLLFLLKRPGLVAHLGPPPEAKIEVVTRHPVAFTSPDHIMPFGTRNDNSTNRKFVLLLNDYVRSQFKGTAPASIDIGCSGGQLVADFLSLNWIAVGLEGSDYSLKHRRANWFNLANKNLFTCDITKPFRVKVNGKEHGFQLITAWEVLEHIHTNDLPAVFQSICDHLAPGGLFIASTNSSSSMVEGVELHQTRMPNAEWRKYLRERFPILEEVDLGLRVCQYVRFDFGEPSFLVYRKKRQGVET